MSDIKDRQDAAPDIDPIVAALADDTTAAAAVEGATEPTDEPDLTSDKAAAETPALEAKTEDKTEDEVDAAEPAEADAVDESADESVSLDEAGIEAAVHHATQAEVEAAVASEIAAALEADLSDLAKDAEAAAASSTVIAAVATESGAEAEPLAATATDPAEGGPALYADTVVELESEEDDDAPLLDDELEDGIASVFAALHSAAQRGDSAENDESDEHVGPLSDSEAIDGVTFRLLGELDRLWHRAA